MYGSPSGSYNVATGWGALTNTVGSYNIAIGSEALPSTIGSSNISIGYKAGFNEATGSNNIAIGAEGASGDVGAIYLGTQGTQTATYIAGIYGETATSGSPVYVTSTGQLGTLTSSARYKVDIESMGDDSRVLMDLRPVRFRYKPEIDPTGAEQFGLVAEEVAEQAPGLVLYDAQGRPDSVQYNLVNAMLLNEVQRLDRENADLRAQLDQKEADLRAQLARQQTEAARATEALATRLEALEKAVRSPAP
jgi:hypothetical protein